MAALSIQVPYPVFYDRDGQPLDNGNIYIGVANLDPVTNPLQVYYDEALTIPASQPLKTSNGYIYLNGTPAQIYVDALNFSILVNDSKNTLVYSFPDGTGIGVGAASVLYQPPFIGGLTSGYFVSEKLSQTVSPEDFGAVGDGITDDSAAFQASVNAAKKVELISGKNYVITTPITVTSDTIIEGNGATITVTANAAFSPQAALQVFNTVFESTTSGTSRGYAALASNAGISNTKFQNCQFGRVALILRDSTIDLNAENKNIYILNCNFYGDYTGVPGGDLNNVIDIRGATDIHITGCTFDVSGIERFMKISGACRRVFITENTIKCNTTTVGKQAIDLFADTREIHVSNNIVDLTGFTSFVENKNGDPATAAEPSEIVVNNNIIKMTGVSTAMSPIAIYGAWGLTTQTLIRSTAKIAGNDILQTGTTALSGTIVVRGMTNAEISRNTLWRNDEPNFAVAIEASNNKIQEVIGNQITFGAILVNLSASHPGSTTYANPPENTLISANQINQFGSYTAVYIAGSGTTNLVTITGNTFRAKAGTGSSGVMRVATGTVSTLAVFGNYGESLTSTVIGLTAGGTVTAYKLSGNSWQSGKTTVTPGTILNGNSYTINVLCKGAAVGDMVSVGLPYDMQGANVEARVSAASNVRILIRNNTGGSLTFAGGTFSAETSRG